MRLVHRDKGCVACLAMGLNSVYRYRDHSSFYNGGHIFPFALQELVRSIFQRLILNLPCNTKSGTVADIHPPSSQIPSPSPALQILHETNETLVESIHSKMASCFVYSTIRATTCTDFRSTPRYSSDVSFPLPA
jgi:hypothetical protein